MTEEQKDDARFYINAIQTSENIIAEAKMFIDSSETKIKFWQLELQVNPWKINVWIQVWKEKKALKGMRKTFEDELQRVKFYISKYKKLRNKHSI
jgi:hypothetical protein